MKPAAKLKIFNDPIYGFIRIPNRQVFELIEHPYFQRLRRISQMGMSYLVYPGAHHTRFHHALGAMHLMQLAVGILREKGVKLSAAEESGLYGAILLHDIGHGPFSHALEGEMIRSVGHETLSRHILQAVNAQRGGDLETAVGIFRGDYPRKFLNQLVASQLDMDRLDYLKRDSFYTGVAEGNINSERLITMLNVVDGNLVVEEKGIYSVEKFLMARRFMYWQVYLHKTGLAAEQLLVRLIRRARETAKAGILEPAGENLMWFLGREDPDPADPETLDRFVRLDDVDVLAAIKIWSGSRDKVLARLCTMLLNRELPKIKLRTKPVTQDKLDLLKAQLAGKWGIGREEADYFVFDGTISNRTYARGRHGIHILGKNGKVRELSNGPDPVHLQAMASETVMYYLCHPKKVVY